MTKKIEDKYMKKIELLAYVLLLLSTAVVVAFVKPVATHPAEIVVPDNYKKIQWAINNASDGDTIYVRAGTYYEHVTINKSISLIGENRYNTFIDGSRTGTVIYVTANSTKISGFTVKNGGTTSVDSGIYLSYHISDSDISYNIITNNFYGILVMTSSSNTFVGNHVTNNKIGIRVVNHSNNNIFVKNNSTNNEGGFYLEHSNNNTLIGNAISNSTHNFGVTGSGYYAFNHNIDSSNTVDGKPIYYMIGAANIVYDAKTNAGSVYLIKSHNIVVKDLILANNLNGIFLWNTTDSRIENVTATNNAFGIKLDHSNNIVLFNNSPENNTEGISLDGSNNNILFGNIIVNNSVLGINVAGSSSNIIASNRVSGTRVYGIQVHTSSSRNILVGNNISNNEDRGIALISCKGNSVYHNNFVNNINQVWNFYSNNTWDNSYPSGGNYWSDYTGVDLYSGPYQNETGSDGIGDTPYVINTENGDRYPLMNVYVLPNMQLLYYELLANFTELQSKYDNLVESYNSLQAQLNNLQSNYDVLLNELNITRNIMYALLITTIVFIATTAYLAIRKPKVKPELKTT